MRFAADFLPVMITVDNWTERTLTPLTLVRIQVPQPRILPTVKGGGVFDCPRGDWTYACNVG